MKRTILLLLLLLPVLRVNAQFDIFPGDKRHAANETLLDRDVDTSGAISKFGPNRLIYVTMISEFGYKAGPRMEGARTNWWSFDLGYGVRTKLKLFYWNSLVFDVNYRYDRFSINQNQQKMLPLTLDKHVRERISLHNVSFAFCDRLNFKKRGDVLGTWIDFGVYADWVLRSTNVYVDRYYDSNSPSGNSFKMKSTIVHLPYVERLNYGFTVRTGGEYFALFAQYRVNKLFYTDAAENRDLPQLTIGLEVSPGWE